jgi:electron transport complex protein RnfG
MNELLRIVVVLTIVTVVSTALLSLVYTMTKPLIERSNANQFQQQLKAIFPLSDSAKKIGNKFEVYHGSNLLGYASLAEAKGYSSTIQLLVGLDPSGTVKGIAIISQQETPGLGSKIIESTFLDQFKGLSKDSIALTKDGGMVDGIAGATISSRALTESIRITVAGIS